MPSTVTGTTPYHHNDLKRLFMHGALVEGSSSQLACAKSHALQEFDCPLQLRVPLRFFVLSNQIRRVGPVQWANGRPFKNRSLPCVVGTGEENGMGDGEPPEVLHGYRNR
jgi:hypothetical protein